MATNAMFWRLSVLIVGLTWLSSLPRHADAQDVTTTAAQVTTATPGPTTTSAGSCQWTQYKDKHTYGGQAYSGTAANEDACKAACIATTTLTCTGIDWNPSDSSKCWLATNEVLYDRVGITHYRYNSTAVCSGGCQPIWTPFAKTNQFGCQSNKSVTTEPDCKSTCLANTACIAIDWDPENTNGEKCWLCFSASGAWSNGTSPGVTHYTVNRNTNCGPGGTVGIQSTIPASTGGFGTCSPDWIEYANTNVGGGSPAPPTTADETACKALCVASPTCTGIDWDSNSQQTQKCWLSGAGGQWFNGTATGVKHYQIVRKTNCASNCDTIWKEYAETNVGGGTSDPAATLDACKAACLANPACTGVDWDDNTGAASKCWLTVTANGQWFNGTAKGVKHYTFSKNTNCGTCPPIWTPIQNTNVGGGTANSAASEDACKTACLGVTACTGIDWDSNSGAASKCWLTVTANGQWFNGTATGVTHHVLNRNTPCNGVSGSVPMGSVTPAGNTGASAACLPIWTPYPNTNVGGGTYNPATTEADCRAACLALPTCIGYDWDPNNLQGQKCWLLSVNGQWFNGTATGVTHYTLDRNINCKGSGAPCLPIWTSYESTLVKGGSPAATATTEDACKAACIASSACTGIDWDPNNPDGIKCWLSGTGVWVNGTATGVRHSSVDRNPNCPTPAGPCPPTWVQYNNTLVKGGTSATAASTDICKTACVSSQTCTGIDWDPNNPDGQTCWLSGAGVWVNGTATGVTHYYLIRAPSPCPGRPTTPATP